MKVVIIRHAEVNFHWNGRCSSNVFDSDCREYDSASIREKTYRIPHMDHQRIYISELSRSLDTARILFPERDYIASELINEVPLRSSFDTKRKMPLWFWNLSGRFQWFLNSSRQIEGCNKTRERAKQFITMVCNENMDCAVITHGFFMHILLHEMKKAGFKTNKDIVEYKNGDYIIAEK
ncbi:MAG: histidine phosphatase family protein [Lachnospiraceae bacterium]|nr:histidine phosphatase family protein [Lachnospiraceae bacterium]